MIERYGINYMLITGQDPRERTPMAERSFLSDPHLARYMNLHERKAVHDFLMQDSVLGNLADHLASGFNHRLVKVLSKHC